MNTISEDQYRKLKQDVEDAKEEASRARGALDQLMERLQDEFQCDSLKKARRLLDELTSKRDVARKQFERAVEEYERKWKMP